jgi:hypothetical protein
VLVYLLAIIGLVSFLLVTSYYRGNIGVAPRAAATPRSDEAEKLPGSGTSKAMPFQSPYHESGR